MMHDGLGFRKLSHSDKEHASQETRIGWTQEGKNAMHRREAPYFRASSHCNQVLWIQIAPDGRSPRHPEDLRGPPILSEAHTNECGRQCINIQQSLQSEESNLKNRCSIVD